MAAILPASIRRKSNKEHSFKPAKQLMLCFSYEIDLK